MMRPVQYAKTLDGKLVAVEAGPHKGWAVGDTVYATEFEASKAEGLLNQRAYIDDRLDEIGYGLEYMIDTASPFAGWREDYSDQDRIRSLSDDIKGDLFPQYGVRSDAAQRFATAFVEANAVYEEMLNATHPQ